MIDPFYRAFEDKFRGSRELIKSRLNAYISFILPFKELYENPQAIDLGCGRGEWLELLKEQGFDAQGVDLDEGMLTACIERGLKVQLADALTVLRSLPNESQTIVSAFHLVEHIPFSETQQAFSQTVYKSSNRFLLETVLCPQCFTWTLPM